MTTGTNIEESLIIMQKYADEISTMEYDHNALQGPLVDIAVGKIALSVGNRNGAYNYIQKAERAFKEILDQTRAKNGKDYTDFFNRMDSEKMR